MRNNVVVFLGFLLICLVNLNRTKDDVHPTKPVDAAKVRSAPAPEKQKLSPPDEKRAEAMR